MKTYNVLIQSDYSNSETKAINHLASIRDDIKIVREKLENLQSNKIIDKTFIPVGSVEFTKEFFKLINIDVPTFNQYPVLSKDFYKRKIELCTVSDLLSYQHLDCFIKSYQLKQFNGFIYKGVKYQGYDNHDKEQIDILLNLPNDTLLIKSNIIDIKYEFRCYVVNKKMISWCQYDDSEDYFFVYHNRDLLQSIVDEISYNTYALDFCILIDNSIAIIELNDAWAIGKYQGITKEMYFDFIKTRWKEIISNKALQS